MMAEGRYDMGDLTDSKVVICAANHVASQSLGKFDL